MEVVGFMLHATSGPGFCYDRCRIQLHLQSWFAASNSDAFFLPEAKLYFLLEQGEREVVTARYVTDELRLDGHEQRQARRRAVAVATEATSVTAARCNH